MEKKIDEFQVIIVLAAVQFLDVLDFMIIMPLGPDFAKDLGIDISLLGLTAGSYTISAAISGLIATLHLDKFNRKKALIFALCGLVFSTIIAGFATSFNAILGARFIAGMFGGPSTALCYAIVSDIFEPERRGSALSKVMSGFSIAAIVGVPLGLEISRLFSWRMAFFVVTIIGMIVIIAVIFRLPYMNIHLKAQHYHNKKVSYKKLLSNKIYLGGFVFCSLGLMGAFMVIPYISAYLQYNLSFQRDLIGMLYFIGGILSFIAMNIIGKLIDKTSSSFVAAIGILLIFITFIFGIIFYDLFKLPILLIFPAFMIGMSIRNVSSTTLISKMPQIHERAGFMALNSSLQHISSALGAYCASQILIQNHAEKLLHINLVAAISVFLFSISWLIMYSTEKRINKDKY